LAGDDSSNSAPLFGVNNTSSGLRQLASARLAKTASTTNGSFVDSSSITFTVGANADFFVSAFLIADALFVDAHSVTGVADAAHTMTASYTAGNVSLLTPVPEASTYGMLLMGLGLLSCVWRRKQSAERET